MLIYNTKSRKKENFSPITNNQIKIYVCGITPYDTTHLGHAFTYVFFDTLTRFLKFKKYNIFYIQNITDIDNDLLKRATERNTNWKTLGDTWTGHFVKDMQILNVAPPDRYVRATASIDKIIELNKSLEEKGIAYRKDGKLYFRVKKFSRYGELSQFSRDQMILIAKERGGSVDDPQKEDPLDFVLWEKSKDNEPKWESPWGEGRPGWHIECSAMISKYLGEQIDIHGGGRDLVFPHHDSEIAQSESYSGKIPFVKYFMHTAMVMYEGEKMSKSLGNLVLISDLVKKYSPKSIRLMLLSHYYRFPWEYHESELIELEKTIFLYDKLCKENNFISEKELSSNLHFQKFIAFLEDDINVPGAISVLKELISIKDEVQKSKMVITKMLSILGLIREKLDWVY